MIVFYELRKIYYHMKRIFIALVFIASSLFSTDRDFYRIERLVEPYREAMVFLDDLGVDHQVNDHDIFVFFNKSDLCEKKTIKVFKSVLRRVKSLTYNRKSLQSHREDLEVLIGKLERVQKFVTDYISTYYAIKAYYEISAAYYYIDEQHSAVVDLLMQQSDKLGLGSMEGRGLYKFVKKLDFDIQRLAILFVKNALSDDLVIKINLLKTKLVVLRNKIAMSTVYKSQLSKTRWLKAFAFLGIPLIIIGAAIVFAMTIESVAGLVFAGLFLSLWFFSLVISDTVFVVKDLRKACVYDMPVSTYTRCRLGFIGAALL